MRHFVPLALDTYFRGDSAEVAFCQEVGAGGNHLVVATASGKVLGAGRQLRLRERELSPVLAEFQQLPASDRRPKLALLPVATRGERELPEPPPAGLRIRGYCTYLQLGEDERPERQQVYYYQQNPDRWAVETQSDMLWLTAAERLSLVPDQPRAGDVLQVSAAIQQRFYSTLGIDYMEGSVNSLPTRESTMTITVERVDESGIRLQLTGYAHLGQPFDESRREEGRSRGCELRLVGQLHCNAAGDFDRFELVGVGQAWGNKMDYTRREMSVKGYPWWYGIACELVTGDAPADRIPPYNLFHYNNSGQPYFPKP